MLIDHFVGCGSSIFLVPATAKQALGGVCRSWKCHLLPQGTVITPPDSVYKGSFLSKFVGFGNLQTRALESFWEVLVFVADHVVNVVWPLIVPHVVSHFKIHLSSVCVLLFCLLNRCIFWQAVDIRQIYDKFPEKGGLKELYDNGPQNVFFLVKFWVSLLSFFLLT